ncbi:Akirin-2 [Cichlidogyrus casuarinus]|uniref:Akirin-2 n=1 Tax=Cichlidogyrus casuarinus TaxID=1844966 RepID=A0ABD2Q5U4_9PLAT
MACVTLKRPNDHDLFNYIANKRRRMHNNLAPSTSSSSLTRPSPFKNHDSTESRKIILRKLKDEMVRMHNRRLIPNIIDSVPSGASTQNVTQSFENLVLRSPERDSSDSETERSLDNAISPSPLDMKPLFNIQQVMRICEKLFKEREEEIRAEYDKILNNRLAEQYEAFLEFNKEHFHTRLQKGQLSCELLLFSRLIYSDIS